MICPACKEDMIVVEYNNIELDYCNDCHGVWFDSTELELLLQSMSLDSQNLLLDDILKSPEAMTQEKKRKCPICGQKMKKTIIGKHPGLLVDICPQEHGLWFDGGEVAQLLKHLTGKQLAGQDSQQQVISFLGEVFEALG
ncbi:MAG: zf-TFIIB domain-containing protein [Chloroflexi bacterium]|nr:zf-TFIIB domain-containing protein [Chloroflexota bacterium]MBL7061990.1 zf-TFIIB domain-containing protein [Dehalococcoidia bacterium]